MKQIVKMKKVSNLAIHMILVHRQKAVPLLIKPDEISSGIIEQKKNLKISTKRKEWKGQK